VRVNLFRRTLMFCGAILLLRIFAVEPARDAIPLIKPAKTLNTMLPFLADLDLSTFSTEEFVRLSSTVGTNRIRKQWTSPVVTLPPHPRTNVHGLALDEVKTYMTQVRQLFNEGKANPMSDVGLVSTQEDVIRKPMLNHIAAFSNAVARVYLLVQKTSTDKDWAYFSIVQDLTVDPPLDYFGIESVARGETVRLWPHDEQIPSPRCILGIILSSGTFSSPENSGYL
jgi:hypothetical protein